jgi:hypothetical protein
MAPIRLAGITSDVSCSCVACRLCFKLSYTQLCPVPHNKALTGSAVLLKNEYACVQGIRLYYRVLDAMRTGDQEKPGRASFATTIKSPSFHKCMLACAFELVIASYRMVRNPD